MDPLAAFILGLGVGCSATFIYCSWDFQRRSNQWFELINTNPDPTAPPPPAPRPPQANSPAHTIIIKKEERR